MCRIILCTSSVWLLSASPPARPRSSANFVTSVLLSAFPALFFSTDNDRWSNPTSRVSDIFHPSSWTSSCVGSVVAIVIVSVAMSPLSNQGRPVGSGRRLFIPVPRLPVLRLSSPWVSRIDAASSRGAPVSSFPPSAFFRASALALRRRSEVISSRTFTVAGPILLRKVTSSSGISGTSFVWEGSDSRVGGDPAADHGATGGVCPLGLIPRTEGGERDA
mmetsp:Transcript_10640/g.23425  ORF Transcript_10640/g.23425 Transcript_10640/m.23425 type:complete len:219 (-) Transcript_10640:120-776(-)